MIQVAHLKKVFKVRKTRRGVAGSLLALADFSTRQVTAVDDISFEMERGEVVGYLGPNGAGKSTTIKILTGLLYPTSGFAIVGGRVPWRERKAHVAHIGVVFGQRTTLWWDLPVIESLELLQYIYKVPKDRFAENLKRFRQLLDLDEFLNTPVRQLSLGQRMRADLSAALLHDPPVLFLDEPTIGLDVVAKERIRQFIQHVNREYGTTVILTTHDLSDVERLCERVLIIDHGRLLYDGALAGLKERFGGQRELTASFAQEYANPQIEGARIIRQNGLQVTYGFERGAISASELINRLSQRYRLEDIEVREPSIEDTVRRIYEGKLLYAPPTGREPNPENLQEG